MPNPERTGSGRQAHDPPRATPPGGISIRRNLHQFLSLRQLDLYPYFFLHSHCRFLSLGSLRLLIDPDQRSVFHDGIILMSSFHHQSKHTSTSATPVHDTFLSLPHSRFQKSWNYESSSFSCWPPAFSSKRRYHPVLSVKSINRSLRDGRSRNPSKRMRLIAGQNTSMNRGVASWPIITIADTSMES